MPFLFRMERKYVSDNQIPRNVFIIGGTFAEEYYAHMFPLKFIYFNENTALNFNDKQN